MASYECEAKLDDIPVLDLSLCVEEECLQTVREACQQLGCFRIVNHGIAPDLLRKADMACREVFHSLVTKSAYYFFPLFFNQTMEEYTCKMMELNDKVHQVIVASFGMSGYYATHFGHRKVYLRMNMYDVSSELSTETIGLQAHRDTSSLTILHEDDCAGGLQVCNRAGNWIDVKPIPNSFVAIMGDCFQAWSNGRILNVKHRVIMKRQQSRLCLAFFNGFVDDINMKAFPEFVDDEHPQCYKEFTYGDFVKYWIGKGRLEVEERLQSFARIAR